LEKLQATLAEEGVANVRSQHELEAFFRRIGLLDLFKRGGVYSFDKKQLEAFQHRHPAIPLIRAARRIVDLQEEGILNEAFEGADGRVHPEYCQLGTATGRQTSRWPNVLGLGRIFRPLVVPEPGHGIGEVDLVQIEVGIAAAVYGDEQLIKMYNTGDVYAAMAMRFDRDRLSKADRKLNSREFGRKYPERRAPMKVCTLGIIFGLTSHGIAQQLGISKAKAEDLVCQFMSMFPALKQAMDDAAAYGGLRGYATTTSGLRRQRPNLRGPLSTWERNWLMNHPVQGTASVLFKTAGNRLDQLYRKYDAWLLVPLHDAYVYEAPLAVLRKVGQLTRRVMSECVQEQFPELHPRAVINDEYPECWNKEGRYDSIDHWLKNPMYSF
jgi:DNA polymerase-1